LELVYLDDNYYAFCHGTSFVAIVTSGQQEGTITLPLTSLEPGVKLCNVMLPYVSVNISLRQCICLFNKYV